MPIGSGQPQVYEITVKTPLGGSYTLEVTAFSADHAAGLAAVSAPAGHAVQRATARAKAVQ